MKYLFVGFLMHVSILCTAQQDPIYSQYMVNPLLLNPAYSGYTNNLNAMVSYRRQWGGWDGAPQTLNASGHVALVEDKMAAGMIIASDRLGAQRITEWTGTYAYRLPVNDNSRISFGLQGGIINYRTDNSKLNVLDNNDPLFLGTQSETRPTVGAGLILHSDRYFVGLSVPRMLNSSVAISGISQTLHKRHIYLQASYMFILSDDISFKPSMLLRYVAGSPVSADVNASWVYRQNYQAGIFTRNLNTIGFLCQALLRDSLRFGYVFEIPTSKSVGPQFTTHEISFGVRMAVLDFHSKIATSSF
jgi:type IX secretion system PorP/SprF family membrane protein